MTDSQDLEEYWAVIRPLRLPPSPTLGTWLDEPEIWLSIVDSSGSSFWWPEFCVVYLGFSFGSALVQLFLD